MNLNLNWREKRKEKSLRKKREKEIRREGRERKREGEREEGDREEGERERTEKKEGEGEGWRGILLRWVALFGINLRVERARQRLRPAFSACSLQPRNGLLKDDTLLNPKPKLQNLKLTKAARSSLSATAPGRSEQLHRLVACSEQESSFSA